MARLRRYRWSILLGTLCVITGYLVIALLMVRGATSSERKPFESHPSEFMLSFEPVEFEARGGGPTLRGWFLPADDEAPYIIFVHGLDGQRTDSNAVAVASWLVEGGYNVLLFDLRGHGESDGDRVSGGFFEREDVLGAYDYLRGRGAERIGLHGFSMGGGIAVLTAALEPGIEAVAVDSPFADVDDLIVQETALRTPMPEAVVPVFLPGAKLIARVFYDIDLAQLVPERDVGDLAYPILVIHGEGDERIPVSHGRRLYDAAPAQSELWTLPEVAHVSMSREAPEAYAERVLAYFDAHLR